MQGLPYVKWFASDWLGSSARAMMTLPERAVYLDLLFRIWECGGAIPTDREKLIRLANVTPEEFDAAWPAVQERFVEHPDRPGMLTNPKMLKVIQELEGKSQAGRKGGIASATRRKRNREAQGQADGQAESNNTRVQNPEARSYIPEAKNERGDTDSCASEDARVCSFPDSSETDSATTHKAELEQQQDAWFGIVWPKYWRQDARSRALKAFRKHVCTQARFDEVVAAIERQYEARMKVKEQYRPLFVSWLEDERWSDEPGRADSEADAKYMADIVAELERRHLR